jgi:phage replication O-like protein O
LPLVGGVFYKRGKMASPQKENGHTDIANELMEKLALLHLSGNEWKIVIVVFRQTWGWHKKEDTISLTQFQKKTEMSRQSVIESIEKLSDKNLLLVGKKGLVNEYCFNKDWETWLVGKKGLVGISLNTSREKGTGRWSVKRDTQKKLLQKKLTKETIGSEEPDKRNLELQSLMDFAKENQFSLQGSAIQNRRYAYNLLRKKDDKDIPLGERVKWLIGIALKCRGVPYAPQVNDFKTMFYKWQDLLGYAQKEKNERTNSKPIIGG